MITDPKLLDKALLELGGALETNLPWLNKCYGKAEVYKESVDGIEKVYPAIHSKSLEYLKMFPDDRLKSFAFFDVNDPQNVEPLSRVNLKVNTSLSIIIWFDYREIYGADADNYSAQNVIDEVSTVLLKYPFRLLSFDIDSFNERVDNVYAGYSHEVINNQFNMRPYGCIKINGTLRYRAQCNTGAVPIVTLPLGPQIIQADWNKNENDPGGIRNKPILYVGTTQPLNSIVPPNEGIIYYNFFTNELGVSKGTQQGDIEITNEKPLVGPGVPNFTPLYKGQLFINETDDTAFIALDINDSNDWSELGSGASETAQSVKTKYESNADTNAFTDSEKATLQNIEANTVFYGGQDAGQGDASIAIGNEAAKFNATTALDGLYIGDGAGKHMNKYSGPSAGAGGNNTIIGTGSAEGNVGREVEAEGTTLVGYWSGRFGTKKQSAYIGSASGENADSYFGNGVGWHVHRYMKGDRNNAFGNESGSNLFGDRNNSFGSDAARFSTGDDHISIGDYANAFTGGDNTIAIGKSSGTQFQNLEVLGNVTATDQVNNTITITSHGLTVGVYYNIAFTQSVGFGTTIPASFLVIDANTLELYCPDCTSINITEPGTGQEAKVVPNWSNAVAIGKNALFFQDNSVSLGGSETNILASFGYLHARKAHDPSTVENSSIFVSSIDGKWYGKHTNTVFPLESTQSNYIGNAQTHTSGGQLNFLVGDKILMGGSAGNVGLEIGDNLITTPPASNLKNIIATKSGNSDGLINGDLMIQARTGLGTIAFFKDGSEIGRFHQSNGFLGLGDQSPTERLSVNGNLKISGLTIIEGSFATDGSQSPNKSIFFGTDGALYAKGGSGTVTQIAPS